MSETNTAERSRKTFSKETIAQIRADRAQRTDDGRAVHSHAALAEKYGTTAGTISQIVRNRTYKDPDYSPVNDGK